MYFEFILYIMPVLVGGSALMRLRNVLRYRAFIRRSYVERHRRTMTDVTGRAPAMPEPVREIGADLEKHGFRLLGATETFVPETNGVHYFWHWVDGLETTRAVALSTPPGAHLIMDTLFQDGAWVQTDALHDEIANRTLHLPDLRAERASTDDPYTVYQTHRQRAAAQEAFHGAPQPVRGMADVLQQMAVYGERHRPRAMRATLNGIQLYALGLGVAAGLIALQLAISVGVQLSVLPLRMGTWLTLFWLLLLGAFVAQEIPDVVLSRPVRRV